MWINLPNKDKFCKPRYQDIQPEQIPVVTLENGTTVKVMAGKYGNTEGPVKGISTSPVFLDVCLPPNTSFEFDIPSGHTCFNCKNSFHSFFSFSFSKKTKLFKKQNKKRFV